MSCLVAGWLVGKTSFMMGKLWEDVQEVLDGGSHEWTAFQWFIAGWMVLIGVMLLMTVLGSISHRWFHKRARRRTPDWEGARKALCEYIADESFEQGDSVPLKEHWKTEHIKWYVAHFLVTELVQDRVLRLPKAPEKPPEPQKQEGPDFLESIGIAIVALIKGAWEFTCIIFSHAFCLPPKEAILNQRDWVVALDKKRKRRLKKVKKVTTIKPRGDYITAKGNAEVRTGSTSSTSSTVTAGRDAVGNTLSATQESAVPSADHIRMLHDLHLALLTDAREVDNDAARVMRKLATELQDVLNSEKGPKDERVKPLMERIQTTSDLFGSLMNATAQALTALNNMGAA